MKVRIGKFGLVNNFLPYFRLEQKGVPIIEAPPAKLAEMFEKGKIDFAPVPSFYYLKNKDRLRSYDFCVASKEKVLSVLVVSKERELDDGSIAITNQTMTSVNLLKIILNERRMKNMLVPVNESRADELLKHCNHALVIGDEAIKARMKHENPPIPPFSKGGKGGFSYKVVMDLGEEWYKLTGSSMVFGISVSPKDIDMSDVNRKVMKSVGWGEENIDMIVTEAEKKFKLPKNFLETYVKSLTYRMGEEEVRGLELFEEKCREHGLL
ncbi:MAG: menaquinone biosynthesis protein [Syntrophales bacterium]|nr:menaquinone biosynthesis protein [Syntrophales bacterium]